MANEISHPELRPKQYRENYGEFIGVGENGNLWVEDRDVAELADEFGTPLFIVSESQFRYTYRQFRDAFRHHYPAESQILFANKSNNGLAYRHIMNQEGAGGDCFGGERNVPVPAGRNRCEHPGAERLQQGGRGTGNGGGQRAMHQYRRRRRT